MIKLETVNELTLKVTSSGGDTLFTKTGAFITGENAGERNYKFDKVLLGPQGNNIQGFMGQMLRRLTGENLPLTRVDFTGESTTYYANSAQHVVVIPLDEGECLSVESENILAFTSDCDYSLRTLASGVISQKGWVTSVLKGKGPNAQVAVLSDGNPIIMSNMENGSNIVVDPDAMICFIGKDPNVRVDVSWKTFIGQSHGEGYMLEWDALRPATIIIQPNERASGISVGVDG
jgi:uncharacterized protein (AIM24 family)